MKDTCRCYAIPQISNEHEEIEKMLFSQNGVPKHIYQPIKESVSIREFLHGPSDGVHILDPET